MKLKLLSFYSQLLSFCLVLLGFNACGNQPDEYGVMHAEYGVPSAKYNVQGKVVSSEAEKAPVKGIRVVVISDVEESENPYLRGDTTYTDSEGKFEVKWHGFPSDDSKFKVKFQDIDGEANGLFEDKSQIVEFRDPVYKNGDGRWYEGEALKDMGNVDLKPKK